MGGDVRWPLNADQQQLLGDLASLIARGGAWRFLYAPVVAGNSLHYPDPWDETRAGVGRVVGRTLWHAYLTIDATVDDLRLHGARDRQLLRDTHIELTHVEASSAVFALSAIGNDDIVGAVSHEVGRAFVGWIARSGHPFRTAEDGLPDPMLGSIATVYLGLGVVAANAAYYDRSAGGGDVFVRATHHEHTIVQCGGLDVGDLAFLLAVQATVRDDVLTALATLRPTQTEHVTAWREVLDDHEAELKRMLGIVDAEIAAEPPPTRPDTPAQVITKGELDERNFHKPNYGQRVFRVAKTYRGLSSPLGLGSPRGAAIGCFASMILAGAVHMMFSGQVPIADLLLLVSAATLIGGRLGATLGGGVNHYFVCASCRGQVAETDDECGSCGGRIAGEIARARDRLDREAELEEAERAAAASSSSASPTRRGPRVK